MHHFGIVLLLIHMTNSKLVETSYVMTDNSMPPDCVQKAMPNLQSKGKALADALASVDTKIGRHVLQSTLQHVGTITFPYYDTLGLLF